jgi:hypothetical protein
MKMRQFVLSLLALSSTALASSTLINYQGGQPVAILGSPQLEGQELGDEISDNTANVYIKPGQDPKGVAALWFHRDAHYRRAEVRADGAYSPEKTYRISYEFSLSQSYDKLVIFQW